MTRRDLVAPAWWRSLPPVGKAVITVLTAIGAIAGLGAGYALKGEEIVGLPDRVERLEMQEGRDAAFRDSMRAYTKSKDERDDRMVCLLEQVVEAMRGGPQPNPFACENP